MTTTGMATLGSEERPLQVAIIGSGPSGFYAAEALIKSEPHVQINLFEKLPAPFGNGSHQVESINFVKNRLIGKTFRQSAQPTESTVQIDCGLCFRSIGYLGQEISGVPFNNKRGVISNQKGRVINDGGITESKLYTSGWIKRGPSGIIGTNRADSVETVATLLEDLSFLDDRAIQFKPDAIATLLEQRKVPYVSYDDWCRIDAAEFERSRQRGKSRGKFVDVAEMLAVIEKD